MKPKTSSGRRPLPIPPKFLAGLFALVLMLFSATAIFQYRSRKTELEHLMREESSILIHALTQGAETALLGYNENNALATGGLIDQLHLIERMDRQHPLTSTELSKIAGNSGMYRLTVFDPTGRRVAWNTPQDHIPLFQDCNPQEKLKPILSGEADVLNLGIRKSVSGKGPRLVVAVARSRGGAIAANVDASRLIELRRELGPGRLIQRIGADTSNIDYIIWQDNDAIISATPNVTDAEPIQEDPELSAAMKQNWPSTRFTTFKGRKVFEVIKPFFFQGSQMGLLRIGLKTDHLDSATKRLQTRLAMLLALAFTGGLAVFSLMVARRNELLITGAYQREQQFSASILENMADALIAVNVDGHITLINDAAENLFVLDSRQCIDKPLMEIVPECGTLLMELIANRSASCTKEFICTVQRQRLVLAGNFSLIAGDNNDKNGAFAVLRDMTGQRAMQKVIARQEKLTAMGELASGIAHEIRNPLNAIGVLGQRLDMEFSTTGDEQEYHQLVHTIVSEVHRVNGIIQRFLKFARPPRLTLMQTELDEWLEQYWPVLAGVAETKGVKLALKADSECCVIIDREQLQQALLNLVRNAVEASSKGEQISVTAERRSGKACIEVADTGKGIPEEMLSQIFNLYFTSKDDGNGMGLSIANQIVQAHGGIIEVDSHENKGSVFSILLPLS